VITIVTTIVSKGEGVIEMTHRAKGDQSTGQEQHHATEMLEVLTAYHRRLSETAEASTLLVRDPHNRLKS
jgi:hypothetical protein